MSNPGLTQWPPVWAHQGKVAAKLGHHSGHRWLLWPREHRTAGTCEELVQRGVPSSDTQLSTTEKLHPDTSTIYISTVSMATQAASLALVLSLLWPGHGVSGQSVVQNIREYFRILCKLTEYLTSKPFLVKLFVDIMMIDP